MTTKARQPMTFDLDRSPQTTMEAIQHQANIEKKQVGARITASKYRQLKSQAALDGVSVQTLVEQAIDQFLANKNN
ncbi:MAG: hypothetical protein QX191_06225 [Methylococcaceae bacterium]